jgi:acetoacetyl-CoA synthetase
MTRTPAISTKQDARILWQPTEQQISDSNLYDFATMVAARQNNQQGWSGGYHELWQWSIDDSPAFWDALWEWQGIIGEKGARKIANESAMPGARFFPDGRLCFAENILADADNRPAISAYGEDGRHTSLTRRELKDRVMALAGWMSNQGVGPGDRVAAYVPNIAETIIIMLATSTLGGVFSSCSPDFGIGGAHDRFSQIEPKLLFACDGYHYAGKALDRQDVVAKLAAGLPSLSAIVIIPYLDATPDLSGLAGAVLFDQALTAPPVENFTRVGFNDPLYILFSSGTTGAPKCIVHGVGGTTLQHAKELRLQSDVKQGDALFFFTTCGWMMWNWMVSTLMVDARIVLFEGNPFHPGPDRLWQIAAREQLSHFGVSAKYIDAVRNTGYRPMDDVDLQKLRLVMTTGSPLSVDGFDFVYQAISPSVQLCSISGGTDIVSCFVLGCPTLPVIAGEIQVRGLGMAVAILDETGTPVTGEQGELCCVAPFPSMPIKFWNDPGDAKYKAAYFEHFPGVWRHGDWATLTERGGIIIHGRSDATLNPGGVRIGTAEIYRQVEAFDEIAEALVVGQSWDNDVRVILFVRLGEACVLDADLITAIKAAIRSGATPRHVPARIIAVPDIPRTRSGKITELAVRDIIHGRPVKNTEALANADALAFFHDLPELAE